ncbi:ABC transporter substrate-binding protein [Acidimangrovimonas sediminis]|uniref:ABC transporter substrate-binding protein n=1 Tax=Acidimangrovimonas sediminis TaxID=2056283 RepID=UPI000C805F3B|nr:ABC transporter substrate-binding protein [Acidimangrovimonas sediminis]
MKVSAAFALTVALVATAPAAWSQEAKDQLVIARAAGTTAMDPGFLRESATIVDNIFDTMVERDSQMKLEPGLALSWKSINPTTWEFKLRPGVKFTDGEPVNAEAVKFSLDRVLNPDNHAPTISYIRTISKVEVVDPMTVRITTSGPDPLLPTRMSRYPAYIVPPKYLKEHGRDYFASHPVGSGPYELEKFVPGQSVELKANDDYWRGAPSIKTVTFKTIPDATARTTALLNGEADIIEDLPVNLVPMVQASPNDQVVDVKNGGLTIYLGLVMSQKPLDNLKVRQALNMAIDRKTIVNDILHGMATVSGTQVGKFDFGYTDIPAPKYDPAAAKKLLAEAGYPNGFTITLESTHRYLNDDAVATAIAQMFGDIGVKVKQKVLDWSVYLQEVPRKGPIFMLGWGSTQTLDADAAIYPIMHSGEPYSTASIPELDKLLDKSRKIVDPSKRAEVLKQVQELAAKDVPLITLYQQDAVYGKAKDVVFSGRADARIPVYTIKKQ